jgi:hypothetical protein
MPGGRRGAGREEGSEQLGANGRGHRMDTGSCRGGANRPRCQVSVIRGQIVSVTVQISFH